MPRLPRVSLSARIAEASPLHGPLALPPIERAALRDQGPTTTAQEEIWLHAHAFPESALFNVCGAHHLRGRVEARLLEEAFRQVIRRHSSLRTRFERRDGAVVQRVEQEVTFALEQGDVSTRSPAERLGAALEQARVLVSRPFDLAAAPLLRARLIRLGPEEVVLAWAVQHIVCDAWGQGVLFGELTTVYDALVEGRVPALPPPSSVELVDYARWEASWLSGPSGQALTSRWQKHLESVPTLLELPIAAARAPTAEEAGRRYDFQLTDIPLAALDSACEEAGATRFMGLFAVYLGLLHRYSGRTDLVVESARANRRPGTESLLGTVTNAVPFRVGVSGDLSLPQLIGRVRDEAIFAYAHEPLPWGALIRQLRIERQPNVRPLCQVAFALQNPASMMEAPELADGTTARNFGASRFRPAGLDVRQLELHTGTSKQDLFLALLQTRQGLVGTIEYAARLFDEPSIERFAAHYRQLLGAWVREPGKSLAEVSILSAAEQAQLAAWNATEKTYPDTCVHQLFEAQAQRTPDAVAVSFEGKSLTYRQLDQRANQLARYLVRAGVGPDVLVGVCLERSLEMVVAVYGVLKAGGAYVPLDPSLPTERLTYMLEDARAPVVVTQVPHAGVLAKGHARLVRLDADWDDIARESAAALEARATPGNLAYVIYTSGSTGKPKGAMNEHRAVSNRVQWHNQEYGLGPTDVVLQKTPFSFDVSVWELFCPLVAGGKLVMAQPEGHKDGKYLAGLLVAEGVTAVHFVPSMLRAFLEQPAGVKPGRLKRVFCSGEALSTELQERFFERLPKVELHNLYGPTECAVDVSAWRCQPSERGGVPIGRPIANARLYVLDERRQQVPIGLVGELYIGGLPVGRGYYGKLELTQERFVPDPFGKQTQARLYRTGDLARWRSDGALEYLGRVDFQVKLRGFRIELGEIESTLLAHPGVSHAVVVKREERLVAYLVGREPAVDVEALRLHLKERLPEYMVPSAFVLLKALPLTPSGKIDRRALPAPEQTPVATGGASVGEPKWETAVERALAKLWAEVLGVPPARRDADFFASGGHSLLAVDLQTKLLEALGVDIPLRRFFKEPTAVGIARSVEELGGRKEMAAAAEQYLQVAAELDQDLRNLLIGG